MGSGELKALCGVQTLFYSPFLSPLVLEEMCGQNWYNLETNHSWYELSYNAFLIIFWTNTAASKYNRKTLHFYIVITLNWNFKYQNWFQFYVQEHYIQLQDAYLTKQFKKVKISLFESYMNKTVNPSMPFI